LDRDETNLQYICERNPYLISRSCKDELDLKLLSNMVSKSIPTKFVGPIMSLVTRPLSNYLQI